MTDLERVRRALGGIYKGEQERPGIRAAYEELDAHLKEDAERDEAWRREAQFQQDRYTELREAVRVAVEEWEDDQRQIHGEWGDSKPWEPSALLVRLRQLIEEKP